jgi:hypothetical protein
VQVRAAARLDRLDVAPRGRERRGVLAPRRLERALDVVAEVDDLEALAGSRPSSTCSAADLACTILRPAMLPERSSTSVTSRRSFGPAVGAAGLASSRK